MERNCNIKKALMCLLISLSLMISSLMITPVGAENSTSFRDVPSGRWYSDAIQYCYLMGYVGGYENHTFRPDNKLTRAEMAVIMSKLLDLTDKATNRFSDVPSGKWFTDPVLQCVKAGVMSGYSEEKFGTQDTLTREQGAVILAKAFEIDPVSGRSSFKDDKSISSWAVGSVKGMTQYGLLSGMGSNQFEPKATMTRAQMCQILYAADGKPSPDRAWKDSYRYIIENDEAFDGFRKDMKFGIAYVDDDDVPELFCRADTENGVSFIVSYQHGKVITLRIADSYDGDIIYEERSNAVWISYGSEEVFEDKLWKIDKDTIQWVKVGDGYYTVPESGPQIDENGYEIYENFTWNDEAVDEETYVNNILSFIDHDTSDYFEFPMTYSEIITYLS